MTHTDDTYNGWANRETWAANLHIDNDPGIYGWVEETAEGVLEDALTEAANGELFGNTTVKERLTWRLAEHICDCITGIIDEMSRDSEQVSMMAQDIGSLWRVNWFEIAEGWAEDTLARHSDTEGATA